MAHDVTTALENDRVIDITTIGRKSGEPRRIEIWSHHLEERFYITGTPDRPRSWYANLVAHPSFTFHLKETTTADLAATARPITDAAEREQVFADLLPMLGDLASTNKDAWLVESPLVEVVFD